MANMNTNLKSAELKSAYAKHLAALKMVDRIQVELGRKAPSTLNREPAEVALAELEDCLARRALGEATEADETQARAIYENAQSAFSAVEKAHTVANRETVGLNRRLIFAQGAATVAEQELTAAQITWLREELRASEEAYTNSAVEVNQSYLRVQMCAAALKQRGMSADSHAVFAGELLIPVIGPTSSALAPRNQSPRGDNMGGFLFKVSRPGSGVIADRQVELDLLTTSEGANDSIPAKISRMVSQLGEKTRKPLMVGRGNGQN
jgi:hypothetical protein